MADRLRAVLRDRARQDVEEAIDWYRQEAGVEVAVGFVDALQAALEHLGERPETGSPRYATELDLPGLRSWLLGRFPYVVFYVQVGDYLDVWRILHAQRDIPTWLREADAPSDEDQS